jgi:O-acetyl-ADP-ribose deacetylase (regulator of RNase III)
MWSEEMNIVIQEKIFSGGQCLKLVHGDITTEHVDAIVNAANEKLLHGGGVAGIISRKGGPVIDRESRAWVEENGPVQHEKPAYTSAGDLPCKYVIHAVGPVWGSGNEDEKLASAVRGSLEVAQKLVLSSLSIPAISTGIFGFPKSRAAEVIINTIQEYYEKQTDSSLQLVRLTLFDQPTVEIFIKIWQQKFPLE